jgi:hypothetical protein
MTPKHFWPFDDRQPVGLTDYLLSSLVTSMIVWPPFLGVAQCCFCFERFPVPFSAAFFVRIVLILTATGAGLGLLCGLSTVLGLYLRMPWVRVLGTLFVAAAFVGMQSHWLPYGFADMPDVKILWRSDAVRTCSGVLLALPGAWASMAVMMKTAAVHPYRDQMTNVFPRNL